MTSLANFVVSAAPPPRARSIAAHAFLDTIGVTLAGVGEPAARAVQRVTSEENSGPCGVIGTSLRTGAANAALANGTAAHALDFDDMCFVSLAHPSAPLVSAALAAGEWAGASGVELLDAYIVGFELEGRLGRAMNPRHYQRGWHCTATIGTIGTAAAAARLFGLDVERTAHALAIAASESSGVKENFGTMVKPLHAGLAARNGVVAAQLARAGLTASASAIAGAQGFLAVMDSERSSLDGVVADLGTRWEIVDTGITVKLYPSCAGTHPTLDALLDLRRLAGFTFVDVERVEVGVDPIVPTILIHDRPTTGLEGKFSMPFCAAAALVHGHVGIDTFDAPHLQDERVRAMQSRVTMRVDSTLDASAPPLTQSRVTVRLHDGRVLTAEAHGARGYPARPASDDELAAKFLSCAEAVLTRDEARAALAALREIETSKDVRALMMLLQPA
ncbi:MAG TPA: MmgE/PrpD family protein [Vicinamibacterales bacterium]|nr:MmgE/PrpD family protein [Vicinamibacterales bacterium]